MLPKRLQQSALACTAVALLGWASPGDACHERCHKGKSCVVAGSQVLMIPEDTDSCQSGNWCGARSRLASQWGYSPLVNIDRHNVGNLRPVWTFVPPRDGGKLTEPIVYHGRLYVADQRGRIWSMDAVTGILDWKHVDVASRPLLDQNYRGISAGDGRVYLSTADGHVRAYSAEHGSLLWDRDVSGPRTYPASAVGTATFAGSDLLVVDTYFNERFSDELTHHDHVTAPTIERALGLDPATGDAYRVFSDFTANVKEWRPTPMADTWPETGYSVDTKDRPEPHTLGRVVVREEGCGPRGDGIHVAVDRRTGAPKWCLDVGANDGGFDHCTWVTGAYDPHKGLMYGLMPELDAGAEEWPEWVHTEKGSACDLGTHGVPSRDQRERQLDELFADLPVVQLCPRLIASHPDTGWSEWERRFEFAPDSGILATAGDLLFVTRDTGALTALDASTGEALWAYNFSPHSGGPVISFGSDGRQYIAAIVSHDHAVNYDGWDHVPGTQPAQGSFITVFGID